MSALRGRGLWPLVAAMACWGGENAAAKYALGGLPAMTVLVVTLATGTAVMWAVLLVKGHRRPVAMGRLALLGLLEPTLTYAAVDLGLTRTQASQASLLAGTESCFVIALGAAVTRRRPARRVVAGVALAFAGVAALGGSQPGPGLNAGDLLVLAGSLAAAVYVTLASRVVEEVPPLPMTAYQFAFGLLFSLPLAAWQWVAGGRIATGAAGPGHWVAAVGCGVGFAAAFLLYNYAITRVSVGAAGIALNLIPLFGLLAAVLALGEAVTRWQLLGAALILGGLALFSDPDQQTDTRPADRPPPAESHRLTSPSSTGSP